MISRMRSSKKAIFFTFIAIMLIATALFSFTVHSRYSLKSKALVIETRVSTMNSFMADIDKDIERGLFISSHRSVLSLIDWVSSEGKFLNDTESGFAELLLNGTLYGEQQSLMESTTFPDWASKMQQQGSRINLQISMAVQNVSIAHSDPWTLNVLLETLVYVKDSTGLAEWNTTKSISALVSILGMEDPIYALKTGGKAANKFNITPFEHFVEGNDTSNLQSHAEHSYYISWSMAPSFLMRLEGNFSTSEYGIESLVNLQELIDQGIQVQQRSIVDHIYWSNRTISSSLISGMPSWFRLDNENNPEEGMTRLERYEAEDLAS